MKKLITILTILTMSLTFFGCEKEELMCDRDIIRVPVVGTNRVNVVGSQCYAGRVYEITDYYFTGNMDAIAGERAVDRKLADINYWTKTSKVCTCD